MDSVGLTRSNPNLVFACKKGWAARARTTTHKLQRDQQHHANATRHPIPAPWRRQRRTPARLQSAMATWFCFFVLLLLRLFFLFSFFLFDALFYFWLCFFFYVHPSSKWLNLHLMLQLQLQQGKIRQTLVRSIIIHLWKGIQTPLFVITVEKSQREE